MSINIKRDSEEEARIAEENRLIDENNAVCEKITDNFSAYIINNRVMAASANRRDWITLSKCFFKKISYFLNCHGYIVIETNPNLELNHPSFRGRVSWIPDFIFNTLYTKCNTEDLYFFEVIYLLKTKQIEGFVRRSWVNSDTNSGFSVFLKGNKLYKTKTVEGSIINETVWKPSYEEMIAEDYIKLTIIKGDETC